MLPGLDLDIHESAWELIAGEYHDGREIVAPAASHPQFAMQALLKRLGVGARRGDGPGATVRATGARSSRREALCPAAATECWQQRLPDETIRSALAHLAVVDAANAEEEALAIAVALREAVETPGRKAALVTPDRALARRVVAALGRWNVAVDNSGGDALADTPAGVFARLAAEAALGGLAPVTLLALLKHPLLRLGTHAGGNAHAIGVAGARAAARPAPAPGNRGPGRCARDVPP